MLCRACLQNYSMTLNSVFALAGVALIESLPFLCMTVADGTINGLIFLANIINIIKDIIFSLDILPPNPLTIILSWILEYQHASIQASITTPIPGFSLFFLSTCGFLLDSLF